MKNPSSYLKSGIEEIYGKSDDFILVGLTGRTGSGCSTVAKILGTNFTKIKHSLYSGSNPSNNTQRKDRIINRVIEKMWQPFSLIQVRSVITLMLLDCEPNLIEKFFNEDFVFDKTSVSGRLGRKRAEKIFALSKKNKVDKRDAVFYTTTIPRISEALRKALGPGDFVRLYQKIGKNIRLSGSPLNSEPAKNAFFTLAKKINDIAKSIHKENQENGRRTFIVIDAIRSPLEAIFFQDRYASFYLMAVSCVDDQRKERLRLLGYSNIQIQKIDEQESEEQSLKKSDFFTVQDIPSCLQRADIYLSNPNADSEVEKFTLLANRILTFIALMRHPGIVTPSAIERCMQVAYAAKLNSGCISRQVGAVVTDENYSVKSIGWNDVPDGQVPCNVRNRFDLVNGKDSSAYSGYEKSNLEFFSHLEKRNEKYVGIKNIGKNVSFCFKSEFNLLKKEKNQVHTRALHAEENAFLQISKYGGIGIKGGYLFTTASPCELCAKKAYQLGISHIYYIDPYPGISESHIFDSGTKGPIMNLFTGAVGGAYHKLYTPIVPYKDELDALQDN